MKFTKNQKKELLILKSITEAFLDFSLTEHSFWEKQDITFFHNLNKQIIKKYNETTLILNENLIVSKETYNIFKRIRTYLFSLKSFFYYKIIDNDSKENPNLDIDFLFFIVQTLSSICTSHYDIIYFLGETDESI